MNKSVVETEKERDKIHKELDLIEVQMQGKRSCTHDDTGDGHDIHEQVDEWVLRDFRLGLVGWITYWCNGDSALTVDVVVALINMLDLEDLVSVALVGTNHKETETTTKIVDLVNHSFDTCEVWSTEEEAHMCPGHFWICKFGTVPGSMSCVEKKFELQSRKWEEFKGTRYYDGDRV